MPYLLYLSRASCLLECDVICCTLAECRVIFIQNMLSCCWKLTKNVGKYEIVLQGNHKSSHYTCVTARKVGRISNIRTHSRLWWNALLIPTLLNVLRPGLGHPTLRRHVWLSLGISVIFKWYLIQIQSERLLIIIINVK